MPTYEYACEGCGSRYEKRESFSAPARQKCPTCGKRANRVLQAPPIVFKGSGFYKTDSRGTSSETVGSNGNSSSGGSNNSASSTSSADSSSESTATPASDTEAAAAT
ncbi:MAG TPA: FmdB family zinc ribbon protein [Dehalococcoidia bacterium]|nr:FmdB family zinc ribbon protein [Dehalococcoidia bacterium]